MLLPRRTGLILAKSTATPKTRIMKNQRRLASEWFKRLKPSLVYFQRVCHHFHASAHFR